MDLLNPKRSDSRNAPAAELGLKTMRLPSGARHDAQMMAKIGPIGMIFVPSVNGMKRYQFDQCCARLILDGRLSRRNPDCDLRIGTEKFGLCLVTNSTGWRFPIDDFFLVIRDHALTLSRSDAGLPI